ncbi:hypothetical protein FRC20_002930 [Serendipita sp. 405]|nr:hypothetical protein FRC20_002930 [Serendipita sp. 405]
MQYTLKSAVIRPDKVALMVAESQRPISPPPSPIPSMEAALRALDSSRASSDSTVQTDAMTTSKSQDDLERASNSTTRRPTRHARSRSITLSLSLPSLPPSLQLLQYQDRSLRRSTSSSLEEGRASPESESDDSTDAILADASRSQSPIREHTSPSNATANQQRGSELLVQLEEGAHTSPR